MRAPFCVLMWLLWNWCPGDHASRQPIVVRGWDGPLHEVGGQGLLMKNMNCVFVIGTLWVSPKP